MARQLDILALEPFFGGIRRNMLETLVSTSRHRWSLLTLPPRRMERRVAASAHWFAEQICRKEIGPVDLLFTCDALNLADLLRLCPAVAELPTVVYFHCNQMPDPSHPEWAHVVDLANLNTASAATEIWFNSDYHETSFIHSVEHLVSIHSELQSLDPIRDFKSKAAYLPPPVDLCRIIEQAKNPFYSAAPCFPIDPDPTNVFIDTHDANMELLNTALASVHQLRRRMNLFVSGPTTHPSDHPSSHLCDLFPVQLIPDHDPVAQVRGLLASTIYLSAKIAAPFDENAVRALKLGCRPVLPHSGFYPELIPERCHGQCLYGMSAESLASHLHEALYGLPMHRQSELSSQLNCFEPLQACAAIDARLDSVVGEHLDRHTRKTRRSKLLVK